MDKVRAWMIKEKDSYIKQTETIEEAMEYACMDANSECGTKLSARELKEIAEVVFE